MTDNQNNISVVYLCRYAKNYHEKLRLFLESTKNFKSGISYNLNIIFKNHKNIPEKVRNICNKYNAKLYFFKDDGFDWGAYIRFAKIKNTNLILFLNSNSIIISENWLLYLSRPFKNEKIKMTGATGSYSSKKTMLLPPKFLFLSPLKYFKYLFFFILDFIFLSNLFDSFPSIHIRSNSFMVKRSDFLAYVNLKKFPISKLDSYLLENGKNSLSKYFLKNNYKIGVVGKDGIFYLPSKWKESKTFKYSNQENLLISDNHTNYYLLHKKNYTSKLIMNFITWGVDKNNQFLK